MANITFTSEKSKATFDISSSLLEMPANIKPYLLVLQAWTSCDTTKELETSQHLRNLMDVLRDRNANQTEVGDAGIQLFLYMYGEIRHSVNCGTYIFVT